MKHKLTVFCLGVFSTSLLSAATSSVSLVNTSTEVKDNTGSVFLQAGAADQGDGDLIQVGYFTGGTSSFSGTWIAITGIGSSNPSLVTSIGDGGDETSNGIFSINITFDTSDSGKSGDLPATGTQLGLRFYNDTTSATATHYNTVTDTSWTFKELINDPSTPRALDMDTAPSLVWQDDLNPFVTSLEVVPEPSSTALLGLGGLALSLRRRR